LHSDDEKDEGAHDDLMDIDLRKRLPFEENDPPFGGHEYHYDDVPAPHETVQAPLVHTARPTSIQMDATDDDDADLPDPSKLLGSRKSGPIELDMDEDDDSWLSDFVDRGN